MTVAPTSIRHGGEHHRSRRVLAAILAFLLGGLVVALLYHYDVLGGSAGSGSGSAASTTEGSGVSATQARDVAAFSSVELAGSNNVVIHVGDRQQQSVVVEAERQPPPARHDGGAVGQARDRDNSRQPGGEDADERRGHSPGAHRADAQRRREHRRRRHPEREPRREPLGSGNLAGSGSAKRLEITLGGSGNVQFAHVVADDVRAVVTGEGTIFVTATGSLDGLHLRRRRNRLQRPPAGRDEERHRDGRDHGSQP